MKDNTAAVHCQVPVEVASFLLNEKRSEITKIELKQRVNVIMVPNKSMDTPHYKLERLKHDDARLESMEASYKLADEVEDATTVTRRSQEPTNKQTPVIKGVLPDAPAPVAEPRPPRASSQSRAQAAAPAPAAARPVAREQGFFAWLKNLFGFGTPAPVAAPQPVVETPVRESREGRRGDRNERSEGRRRNGDRNGDRNERNNAERGERQDRNRRGSAGRDTEAQRQDRPERGERGERNERGSNRRGGERNERRDDRREQVAESALNTGEELNVQAGEGRGERSRQERGEGRRERQQDRQPRPAAEQQTAQQLVDETAANAGNAQPGETVGEGEQSREPRQRRSRDRYGRDRRDRAERGDRAPRDGEVQAGLMPEQGEQAQQPVATVDDTAVQEQPARRSYFDVIAAQPVATPSQDAIEVQAPVPASVAQVEAVAVADVSVQAAEPAVVAEQAPAAAEPAPTKPAAPAVYALPMAELQSLATASGLQWINSDPEKIAAVQAAIAAEPKPVHIPRERPPMIVLDEGPLILVETRKDLSHMQLPFEQAAAAQ
jgi:ribonuclease E